MLVSGKRINDFLLSEEMDMNSVVWRDKVDEMEETAIEIKNGNFYWVDPKKDEYLERKQAAKEALKGKKKDKKAIKDKNAIEKDKSMTIAETKTDSNENLVEKDDLKKNTNNLTEPLLLNDT